MNWTTFVVYLGAAHAFVQFDLQKHSLHSLKRSTGDGQVALENTLSFYQTELLIGNPPQPVLVQIDTGSSDLWVISSSNPYCRQGGDDKCADQSSYDPDKSHSFRTNDTSPFMITYCDSTFASGRYVQDDVMVGVTYENHGRSADYSFTNFLGGKATQGDWFHPVKWSKRPAEQPNFQAISTDEDSADSIQGPQPSAFTIRGANFALADKSNSSAAVWGIGLESIESMAHHKDTNGNMSPTYSNLPMQMKEQGFIETVAYSLWLNDLHASAGSLLFGAVDHAKYLGQLQKVPLVSTFQNVDKPVDFSVMLHGIGAYNEGNKFADIVKCSVPVLLDSGTTYTQLPMKLLRPISEALGAVYDPQSGMFLLSESRRQTLVDGGLRFNLSGIQIDVAMDEILVPIGPRKHASHKLARTNSSQPEVGTLVRLGFDNEHDLEGVEMFEPDDYNLDPSDFEDLENVSEDMSISDSMSIKARKHAENYYLLGIFPVDISGSDSYILGDTFLRSAYVVYDLEEKEVALANTYYNATDSEIDVIGSSGIPSAKPADLYSSTQVSDEIVTFAGVDIFDRSSAEADASVSQTFSVDILSADPREPGPTYSAAGLLPAPTQSERQPHHRNGASSTGIPSASLILLSSLTFLLL